MTSDKITTAADRYLAELERAEALVTSITLKEILIEFGRRIRRQTIREERARNKRVAAMFKKEPSE